MKTLMIDCVVIGGGFYGCMVARHLKSQGYAKSVRILEREPQLMSRSSRWNQARVHQGYHYPRAPTTALRSRMLAAQFISHFPEAIRSDFQSVYGVAAQRSFVTPRQFKRFCQRIGAPLSPAPQHVTSLFKPGTLDALYVVQEAAFDANTLALLMVQALQDLDVEIQTSSRVSGLEYRDGYAAVEVETGNSTEELKARRVYVCTYGSDSITGNYQTPTGLKFELAEMAIIKPPAELSNLAITIVDGPFFSMMPFPAMNATSLSHVRHTPRMTSTQSIDFQTMRRQIGSLESNYDRMIRSAARFVPLMAECAPITSVFEVKCLLQKHEVTDSRPILFYRNSSDPYVTSIVGGKIDNVFDVLTAIDVEMKGTT
jgi:glycine/D-amino acid oxidase-like deaminating enzyme